MLPTDSSHDPAHRKTLPANRNLLLAGAGLAILAATALTCALASHIVHRPIPVVSTDMMYVRTLFRFYVIMIGCFLAALLMIPTAEAVIQALQPRWRPTYTWISLAAICAFLSTFLIHFGRWQFGGWDYNIMIEVGWRQILGQQPYVDFVTPTPPGFNLGIKYAFQLFGVSWNANLYFSAIFACLSFLWMYWLMVRVGVSRLASMLMSFAIEVAVMLTLCFWWYNNSTLILATLFFLSCLFLSRASRSPGAQISYVLSLALLLLLKPNIAGVTAAGSIVLLLLVTDRKRRVVLLTTLAVALAIAILLTNGVSIRGMFATYHGVAKERGGFSTFGFDELNHFGKLTALIWVAVLTVPLISLIPRVIAELKRRDHHQIAYTLFFPLALVVALYGIATNGEIRDLECGLLLAAGAVIVFGMRISGPSLSHLYIAAVLAGTVADLYIGAIRARVYTIGPHQFFEWADNQHEMGVGFLNKMRVSSTMKTVVEQIGQAEGQNPGPYFFGPRLDFSYAALGLSSPRHYPTFWQPGTAFDRDDENHMMMLWKEQNFQTLIFLREDYTFYSDDFMDIIEKNYLRDDRYSALTVYHVKAGS